MNANDQATTTPLLERPAMRWPLWRWIVALVTFVALSPVIGMVLFFAVLPALPIVLAIGAVLGPINFLNMQTGAEADEEEEEAREQWVRHHPHDAMA